MKARIISSAIALALGLMVVTSLAVAGDQYRCTAGTQKCLDKMATMYKGMGWLGIERKWDETTHSVAILKVVPDSPASKAGFRVGDHIVAMNGLRFIPENEEKLQKIQHERKPGARFEFTRLRDGKEKVLAVILGRMPEDIIAAQIGHHMLEHVTPDTKGDKTAKKEEN
jgi:predicted metalloprotease with PDZ domain